MSANPEAEEYLREAVSLKTLAKMYDMSYQTLSKYVREGTIPKSVWVKIGKHKRVKLPLFKEWLERQIGA